MKRFIAMLLLVTVLTGVLVGTERKGSFDLAGKDPEILGEPERRGQDPEYPVTPNVMGRDPEIPVTAGKKGSFDITEKKGSFDITAKSEGAELSTPSGNHREKRLVRHRGQRSRIPGHAQLTNTACKLSARPTVGRF